MITAKLVKELRDLTGAGMLDCKKALEATNGDIQAAVDWLREKGIASAQKKAGRIAAEGSTNAMIAGNRAIVVELNSETDFVAKNESFIELVNNVSTLLLTEHPADLEAALALDYDGSQTVNDAIVTATSTIGEKISLRRFEIVEKNEDQVFGTYIHMGGKISAVVVLDGNDDILAKDIAMQVASMAPEYITMAEIPQDLMNREREIQTEALKNDPNLAAKPENVVKGIVEGRVKKTFQEISLNDQPFFKDSGLKVADVLKQANTKVVAFVRYAVGEGIEKREENFADEVAKAAQV